MSSDLTIVTVADRRPTASYYTYDEFFASARKFGHEPLVLGQKPGEYKGLQSKPKLLQRALRNNSVTTPYLLFCDCFDVVFAQDPSLCVGRQSEVYPTVEMIIGGETNCFPDANLSAHHVDYGTPFRYVNSGFLFARTDVFVRFLEEMDPEKYLDDGETDENLNIVSGNDQDTVMRSHLFGSSVDTQIDYKAALVLNLCGLSLSDIECSADGVRVCSTSSFPIAIHWNGPAKTGGTLEPVLNTLGYPR